VAIVVLKAVVAVVAAKAALADVVLRQLLKKNSLTNV
jgi:hypothetical protein